MRVHKKTIHMGNCLKRAGELGKFAGGLVKNREGVFEGGWYLDAHWLNSGTW